LPLALANGQRFVQVFGLSRILSRSPRVSKGGMLNVTIRRGFRAGFRCSAKADRWLLHDPSAKADGNLYGTTCFN
jgi:hypothetical protein